MTNQEIRQMLIDAGIENPSQTVIRMCSQSIKEAYAPELEAAVQAEKDKYKDYKSADEYKKLEDEIASLKDSSAKEKRMASYKNKGIAEKWLDYADGKLKDEKDFDKALDKFIEENAELVAKKEEPKTPPQPKPFSFGGTGSGKVDDNPKVQSYEDAIRADLKAKK